MSPVAGGGQPVASVKPDQALGLPSVYLISALLLLVMGLGEPGFRWVDGVFAAFGLLMLLIPRVQYSPLLWFSTAGLAWVVIEARYAFIDNHKWLIAIWLSGVFVSLFAADAERLLSRVGRMLLMLLFPLSIVQKVIAGEYYSGDFFHLTFLVESRFAEVPQFLAGIERAALTANAQVNRMGALFPDLTSGVLNSAPEMHWAAVSAAFWAVVLEGSIGLAFGLSLLPRRWLEGARWKGLLRGLASWRNPLLLLFIISTYALVPLSRFGGILSVFGYAQAQTPRWRWLYLGAFIAMNLVHAMNEGLDAWFAR